jgi:hypothetical protein
MATPADQRLLELLERWLKSLELHAKYSSLDDDSYWKIQPWVKHQRPSLWIIELAMQKTIALRTHVQERVKMGDAKYADSLELMNFLANLVGSEHIERFIPSAEPQNERSATQELPDDAAPPVATSGATATREMPNFHGSKRAPAPPGTTQVARAERKVAAPPKSAARPASKQPARVGTSAKAAASVKPSGKPASRISPAAPSGRDGPSDVARTQVIADAARLVQWGRKWYELPELIARMADRPSLPEVRRILKENKSAIDAKAGGA